MKFDIIVLLKQVPDTRDVTVPLMTAEGTVNRNALPTIANPDDLAALTLALELKAQHPATTIRLLTMGPPSAVEVLREGLWRGADSTVLLTDRALGGADTLATSYALAQAIRRMGMPDFVFCGQQSLDGDTAHVGAQVAEWLGIDQRTNVVAIRRDGEGAWVAVQAQEGKEVSRPLRTPTLVAVNGAEIAPLPYNAHALLRYKHAATPTEQAAHAVLAPEAFAQRPHLTIEQWGAAELDADSTKLGQQGSPTRVVRTEEVRFAAKASEHFTDRPTDIARLMSLLA